MNTVRLLIAATACVLAPFVAMAQSGEQMDLSEVTITNAHLEGYRVEREAAEDRWRARHPEDAQKPETNRDSEYLARLAALERRQLQSFERAERPAREVVYVESAPSQPAYEPYYPFGWWGGNYNSYAPFHAGIGFNRGHKGFGRSGFCPPNRHFGGPQIYSLGPPVPGLRGPGARILNRGSMNVGGGFRRHR